MPAGTLRQDGGGFEFGFGNVGVVLPLYPVPPACLIYHSNPMSFKRHLAYAAPLTSAAYFLLGAAYFEAFAPAFFIAATMSFVDINSWALISLKPPLAIVII